MQLMKQTTLGAAALAAAFSALGCAAQLDDDGFEPEPIEPEAEVQVTAEALESWRTGRTRTDYPGAVYLEGSVTQLAWGTPIQGIGCTGALIAPDLIMTAAHCVNQFANKAIVQIAVEALIDGSRRCITDFRGADTNCLTTAELNDLEAVRDDMARVQIFRNVRYRDFDASTDVAVIKLLATDEQGVAQISDTATYRLPYFAGLGPLTECDENGARNGKSPCYMRVMKETPGGWFEWSGWGATRDNVNDGGSALNFGVTRADWVRAGHFGRDTVQGDLERSCKGDSGGPAVLSNANHGINNDRTFLMGVFHGFEDLTGNCANAGGLERWGRVDNHTWLITNSSTLASDAGAGRACSPGTVNGLDYVRCYDASDWQR